MTLRLKNIIFFKIVFITLAGLSVFYALKLAIEDLNNSEYKMIMASRLVATSQLHYDVIKNKSNKMLNILASYSNLKKFENIDLENAFDKDDYLKQIKAPASNYKL
ncbi:MAG: hypothetical protein SFT68_01125, partial [Rickettsiaceae bacterium]|nr:hypothetical protein [Rickettsiaceae bacterium]